jgi:chemotaxis protein CheX
MTATDLASGVSAEEIVEITKDVWASFLVMDLERAPDVDRLEGPTLTGCVHISGAWNGSVFVQATTEHAVRAAEAMFAADPGTLGQDEVGDALGELTNMVGGNVKGLLPVPSSLSLPSVAGGESYTLRVPGAALLSRVSLVGPAGPLLISLWRS